MLMGGGDTPPISGGEGIGTWFGPLKNLRLEYMAKELVRDGSKRLDGMVWLV